MSVWMRFISTALPLGIVISGLVAGILWSLQSQRFPILAIEIRNELKHVAENDIAESISSYLSKGFFGLDVEAIQQNITRLPWVASVSVRRIWPDRLSVSIHEQMPQVCFGEDGILNSEGFIFYPEKNTIPKQLPRFNGPKERAKEMLEQYHAVLETLSPVGLSVTELNLAPNGAWQMILSNGVALLVGKSEMNEKLARFVLAYQTKLQALIAKIAYVDLRYTNGLAIGWKN